MSLLALAVAASLVGVWTNEEQVSFAREARTQAPPWTGFVVDDQGRATPVDAHGREAGPARKLRADEIGTGRLILSADGVSLDMRRARRFACWAAVPKQARKADGSEDWWGKRDIALHDQGGRADLVTDEPVPQRFTLKMRNVVWPAGPNQPSLVLYVLTPDGGERAVAYSWADPPAKRVGINIRTLQASCSLVD